MTLSQALNLSPKIYVIVAVICGCIFSAIFLGRNFPGLFGQNVVRQTFTIRSMVALEQGQAKLQAALIDASIVISRYGGEAQADQEKLAGTNEAPPPLGQVPPEQRSRIFARGVLNDVAACYFTMAQALQAEGRTADAHQAYLEASKLTYARVWDPRQEIFWSPADAALGQLRTSSQATKN